MARYRLHRTITVSGFVADADPRVTPPADSLLFEVQREHEGQLTKGHAMFFRVLTVGGADVADGSVTFTPWMKDDGSGAFVQLDDAQTLAANRNVTSDDVGKLWPQVTAVSGTSAATVECWIAERANVALLSA